MCLTGCDDCVNNKRVRRQLIIRPLSLTVCLFVCLCLSGSSASDLVLQCTPEGIRLQCYMNYYTEEMKTVWKHKYSLRSIFTLTAEMHKGLSRQFVSSPRKILTNIHILVHSYLSEKVYHLQVENTSPLNIQDPENSFSQSASYCFC